MGLSTPTAFARSFESAEAAVAGGAPINFAHGLGVRPKSFMVYLRCKTADLNFAVGDEIPISNSFYSGNQVVTVTADSVNITLLPSFSTNFSINNKTTVVPSNITLANWKFFVRAQA